MRMYFRALIAAIVVVAFISLSGCNKDEDDNVTPTPTKYELRFTCTSSNPYLIEVAGNSDLIWGGTYNIYKLNKGTYAWKVTQQSGYILYPTIKEGTVNLDQDKEIVFP